MLIICVDLGLDRRVSYVQREKDLKDYRRLAWKSNGLLQRQRLAHEEAGFGTWERCAKNVPVTIPGETLAILDVNDREHPTLLKTPVLSNQPLQPKSTTTHIGSPQKTDTTAITALSAEIEPKPVDGDHETGGSPFSTNHSLYTNSSGLNRAS